MQVSLEISLYPLTEEYLPLINEFLRKIHSSGLEAVTNGISTQVFGEFDEVMEMLNTALRPCMEGETKVAISMKMLNSHLPPDRWDPAAWS
ncbi:MAG: thiamine-binding protein [Flavobacteriales bacterium]|nr:thiamine-binding protein [Flavobacteriales bacterium]